MKTAKPAPACVYFYRAVDGTEVPDLFRGDPVDLTRRFRDSVTPILRVIPIDGPATRAAVLGDLQARLERAAGWETGLLWNLHRLLKAL